MPSKQIRNNRKNTTGRRPSRSMQIKKLEPKETTRFTEKSRGEPETPNENTDSSVLISDEGNGLENGSSDSRTNSQREVRIISDAIYDLRRTGITVVISIVALAFFVISS